MDIIFEIIGVVSFAISGTIVAMKNKMDVVGTIILANITSFGGGVLRDLLLGITPPKLFTDPYYFVLVSIATMSSIVFMLLTAILKKYSIHPGGKIFNLVLNVMDAVGLAPFCLVGVNIAIEHGHDSTFILCVIGCIAGCGGGILRDVLAHRIPIIFQKYIYLTPCLVGVLAYVLFLDINNALAYVVGLSVIIGGRILGILFNINMPVIPISESSEENSPWIRLRK